MITIKDVFEDYKQLNKVYGKNELEAITLLVMNEVTQLSKASIKAFPERVLSNEQTEKMKSILIQLQTGKPVQYILGVTEFYGLPFKVNPFVLIPRPETEELVEWILTSVDEMQELAGEKTMQYPGSILDIGTGSGCIAIALKKNLANAPVSAIDISEGALQTAKENAALNEVNITFIHADILNINAGITIPKSSIMVSNPPYVTLEDKIQMHTNVTDFEPHSALFVPEHEPLIFYNAIADFALLNLLPGGVLFFEINESYGHETVELLEAKGFKNIVLRKDMSDRYRMVKAVMM
ncbi:peptide chain release factor N(5)-glutamine methyltransferase [Mucilaginibacter sp. SP1R1]|uniref:peptide chain release factor N(5)-glutamine methyltransferase n=1 Tax=Mucilaginibacter sp. SP1R1 TaxID=2723091 RepID=UPI00161142E1|nr:peptide chain release factor N(5)-glutamine methyltransferase [Mucilaginibacter sp. SP1R1]MBB6149301.1 release factor glutamine methyltransferase [Mucilaginibacter sp. SP1R1]